MKNHCMLLFGFKMNANHLVCWYYITVQNIAVYLLYLALENWCQSAYQISSLWLFVILFVNSSQCNQLLCDSFCRLDPFSLKFRNVIEKLVVSEKHCISFNFVQKVSVRNWYVFCCIKLIQIFVGRRIYSQVIVKKCLSNVSQILHFDLEISVFCDKIKVWLIKFGLKWYFKVFDDMVDFLFHVLKLFFDFLSLRINSFLEIPDVVLFIAQQKYHFFREQLLWIQKASSNIDTGVVLAYVSAWFV